MAHTTTVTHEQDVEQNILAAAEAEFLEKGYAGARTVAIAARAGVNHSMLHYYFRSKEKLFRQVFLAKVQTMAQMFGSIYEQPLPFADIVRLMVETQFNFVWQNPQLPHFIMNEIVSNESNRQLLLTQVRPQAEPIFEKLAKLLEAEITKGAIVPITPQDLFMTVIALNVAPFVALPLLKDLTKMDDKTTGAMLAARREYNVQFILNALRPY